MRRWRRPVTRVAPLLLFMFTGRMATGQTTPADGQWTMPGKDYAATRYSRLAQITPTNVKRLHPVWSFSTGVLGGHQGQPLIVNSTMYVVTPYPNVLYAFDLATAGYPLKWKYRPAVEATAPGMACCDAVNRGAAYAEGKIVYNLLDGHTVAVDATSGRELWRTKIADLGQGETTPMAPLIVRHHVLVGASGAEFGVLGWMKALDLTTGHIEWTATNLGPDSAVLAKPGVFKPFYEHDTALGLKSWPAEGWRHGGAPVWGWLSYDPTLDLVYYGTGNPAPANPEQRIGDNRWTSSVLARRPDDGALVWAYQFTPHDSWDFDAVAEMVAVDLTIKGRLRKTLVHFDKNGFAYTIDRATGEVLVAEPYVPVTWATRVDLATGRPEVIPSKVTGASRGNVRDICPSAAGGKSPAAPSAYSPRTGLFYASINTLCMDFEAVSTAYLAGTPFFGASTPFHGGAPKNLGGFIAWDAAQGRKVWETTEQYPVSSGSLATGGDVVFYGTLDGWLKAVDARTGAPLWKFKVGSGVIAAPITYTAPDGKQYVAVYAGFGGVWLQLAGDVLSNDPADLRDPADIVKDLARHTSEGGIVWIFAL